MALVTVVRNLTSTTLELPGGIKVRPWHYTELETLTDEMRKQLRELESYRQIQLGQVLDGLPLPVPKV